MKQKKRSSTRYSVDETAKDTLLSLVSDFRSNLKDPEFCCTVTKAIGLGDVLGIREECGKEITTPDSYEYKCEYQVKNFLKRYRFKNDLYTNEELTEKAIQGFRGTQTRFAENDYLGQLDTLTSHVLDVAADYIAKVLGVFSDDEHRSLCRFGSKASVGVTLRKACEAERWSIPITGSAKQIDWFRSEMDDVACVQGYLAAQLESDPNGSIYQEISCLTLALVPKTFKSLRSIMPNTTIGGYMTSGLGSMIQRRLKRAGYNINTLQEEHKVLACKASVDELNVTVDLSAASDTISTRLVERLLPRDWFDVLNNARIGTVKLPDDTICEMETFCTMGVGYTFPLQTLIFLSLLKAIARVTHWDRPCDISVYGDDMIFGRDMYPYVEIVFRKLGFVINVDKTFVTGPFRESCGGDYHAGVDVRPFQPKGGQEFVGSKTYEAVLYKSINGLLRRWSEYEITGTLGLLLSKLRLVTNGVKIVPRSYPEDSGIRCSIHAQWSFLSHASVERTKQLGHGIHRFSYLRFVPDEIEEVRHEPYLWVALRSQHVGSDYHSGHTACAESVRHPVLAQIELVTGVSDTALEAFHVVERLPVSFHRLWSTGERVPKVQTNRSISGTGKYKRQSGTSCFDDR